MNLTKLVKIELRRGTSKLEILEMVQSRSPKPQNWNLASIRRIERSMGITTINNTPRISISSDTSENYYEFTNRTFGVEIEFLRPSSMTQNEISEIISRAGIPCESESYNHNTRNHWKIVYDASVHGSSNHIGGNEIVSPILSGQEGLDQLKKVLEILNTLNCKINKSCGIHVHHKIENRETIMATAIIYKKFQNQINNIMPQSRKSRNTYCRRLTTGAISTLSYRTNLNTRYYNVNPNAYTRQGTVEFRQHAGSLDYNKISNWVLITQSIVERANEISETDIVNHSFKRFHKELKHNNNIQEFFKTRKQEIERRTA